MVSKIDCEQIPKFELEILSRTLLTAIELFFSNPDNLKGYEAWLQTEEGQYYAAQDERPCAYSLS